MKSVSMAQSKIKGCTLRLVRPAALPARRFQAHSEARLFINFIRTETLDTPYAVSSREAMIVNRVPFLSVLRSMKSGSSSCALGFFAFGFNARRAGERATRPAPHAPVVGARRRFLPALWRTR